MNLGSVEGGVNTINIYCMMLSKNYFFKVHIKKSIKANFHINI